MAVEQKKFLKELALREILVSCLLDSHINLQYALSHYSKN